MYIARTLARHQDADYGARDAFRPILIYVGVVCGLIFTEDFSTAFLIGFIAFLMMFIGRVPFRYLFTTVGAVVGFVVIVFLASPYLPFLHRAETWENQNRKFCGGR